MSSHWDWALEQAKEHDEKKPFAPENGLPLKFKIGQKVIFKNPAGVTFRQRVTGYYERKGFDDSQYTSGKRYLLDCPPVGYGYAESSLMADNED